MRYITAVIGGFILAFSNACDINLETDPEISEAVKVTGIELEGMFRYMADAAIFLDCRTGKAFPVSMEAQYIELERAYLNSGIAPGGELMVRLRGRYLERPAMEGDRNEVQLIVDKIEEIRSGEACEPSDHASLTNTFWKLLELNGESTTTAEGAREIHLILASASGQEGARVHGHAGCNNFFGSFHADEESLTFSALGSTMMACPEGMDTEQAFMQALGEVDRASVSGQFLELFSGDILLARFEAIYLL
jgi:copper homeostasis protein (lipoprotein)